MSASTPAAAPPPPTSVEGKIATAKQSKNTADEAFKAGNVKAALAGYHGALFYLLGIDKTALKGMGVTSPAAEDGAKEEKTEVDELVEKIYANMSACHLKTSNWKRAVETADKALAKNAASYKAMFRKGKALGELGYFERAVRLLEELKAKNPTDGPLVDQELKRLKDIDHAREKVQNQKLKGFLTRDKGEKKPTTQSEPKVAPIASGFIEEVNE